MGPLLEGTPDAALRGRGGGERSHIHPSQFHRNTLHTQPFTFSQRMQNTSRLSKLLNHLLHRSKPSAGHFGSTRQKPVYQGQTSVHLQTASLDVQTKAKQVTVRRSETLVILLGLGSATVICC